MNEQKTPKNKALWLVLGVVLALALAAGLYFGIRALSKPTPEETQGSTEETQTPTGSYEYDDEDRQIAAAAAKSAYTEEGLTKTDARLDAAVASCGGKTIDSRQAQIYYCFQYFNFMSNYGSYASMFGLDNTKPLSEQPSTVSTGDESVTLSWEQYFLMAGLEDFHQYAAAAAKAEAEGYTMSEEDTKELEDAIANLREEAAGYEDPDAYLQESFGATVGIEEFEEYLRLYFLAMSYENHLYESIQWSDADLKAYYDAHPEEFQGMGTDQPNVAVRHILILSDPDGDGTVTDEEKSAAETKANELLQSYLQDPSEDKFAALAKENSEDPGSKDEGGLYDDVYPGQMVEAFNDWCFDASRKPGDTAVVETEYGFHVMYFVKTGDTYQWKTVAEQNYPMSIMDTHVQELLDAYPLELHYENVLLGALPQPESSEQENPTES